MTFKAGGILPKSSRHFFRSSLISFLLIFSLPVIPVYPTENALQSNLASVAASPGPTLNVDVTAQRHSISPDIYGVNQYSLDPAAMNQLLSQLRPPVVRWGGNLASRYNWQVDASNHGSDYFFVGGDGITAAPNPPSGQANLFIDTNRTNGSKSLLTIPIIPYVNKSNTLSCSFKVDKYPGIVQQQVDTSSGLACGNGIRQSNGLPFPDTDILYNHVQNTPTLQQDWVTYLVGRYGNAGGSGVQIYEFDNEPSDWFETHRDVHPGILTYEELRDLTYQYGPVIKAADPTAKTLGPSDFGWTVYVDSMDYNGRDTHGGTWFAEWYLQQMKAYEDAHGLRILDYFDEHYYPDSNSYCISLCPAGNAATQAERLKSTRSLWDPTYVEDSWIGDAGFGPIRLIPRFREWVNQDYPGTKTAITEYNFGGLEALNGALTQADVLGIFGREQLDLATLWDPPTATQPGAYAFRMYLNYDGAGAKFGDTSVLSSSADQGQLAIYGAQRSSDNALTLMLINKTGGDLTSSLSLNGFSPATTAQVYRYSSANLNAIVRQSDLAVTPSGFSATYPANSITLVVIPSVPLAVYSATPIGPGNSFRLGVTHPNITKAASFTITNSGSPASNLQVALLGGSAATALTGPNAAKFALTNAGVFPLNLAGGASQAVNLTCTPTALGMITASLSLTHSNGPGQPDSTVVYALICSGGYIVSNPVDDGSDGTLSFGLSQTAAQVGGAIGFELVGGGNTITFVAGSHLPLAVKTGVSIEGSCNGGPQIIINGSGNGGDGLTLSGNNYIFGLQLQAFGGRQLVALAPNTGNRLSCVVARK